MYSMRNHGVTVCTLNNVVDAGEHRSVRYGDGTVQRWQFVRRDRLRPVRVWPGREPVQAGHFRRW